MTHFPNEYPAKAILFLRRFPMKSVVRILTVCAVTLASTLFAQTDTTATDPSSGLKSTHESVAPGEHVRRAVFATGVARREPVGELESIPVNVDTLWFFSEIVDHAGGSITHRWLSRGKTQAEVIFKIGGPRWRVYSSKLLPAGHKDPWTVEIVDGDGNVLHRQTISRAASADKRSVKQSDTKQDG
jgi:hypothetical protein